MTRGEGAAPVCRKVHGGIFVSGVRGQGSEVTLQRPNSHNPLYAEGVTDHSPGSRGFASAPWVTVRPQISGSAKPNRFLPATTTLPPAVVAAAWGRPLWCRRGMGRTGRRKPA